jgi:hypothetical protein
MKRIGYGQKTMTERKIEREFFIGDSVNIYITNPDDYFDLERKGIYVGWTVKDDCIYLVLEVTGNIQKTRLIPLSRIIPRSLAKLGGCPKSAFYELGNLQREKIK